MSKALKNKIIWLTGASSGIGLALTEKLIADNNTLIVTSRNTDSLVQLKTQNTQDSIHIISADLSSKQENVRVCNKIQSLFGRLDIAIFNAGTCEYIDGLKFDSEVFAKNIQINLLGLAYGIECALPLLFKSDDPQLVAMSSAATYLALPRASGYGASKIAIQYLMRALSYDLGKKVSLSTIHPGFVKTPLTDRNDFKMPCLISAETAAEEIIKGIASKQQEIHFPKKFTIPMKLLGVLPFRVSQWLINQGVNR